MHDEGEIGILNVASSLVCVFIIEVTIYVALSVVVYTLEYGTKGLFTADELHSSPMSIIIKNTGLLYTLKGVFLFPVMVIVMAWMSKIGISLGGMAVAFTSMLFYILICAACILVFPFAVDYIKIRRPLFTGAFLYLSLVSMVLSALLFSRISALILAFKRILSQ